MTSASPRPAQLAVADLDVGPHRWPVKTRELHSHHFDSTIWNDFRFRDDDIVIATYGKSGTTWMQQIVSQLIFGGEEGLNVGDMSPWMDLRVPPAPVKLAAVEAQTHRRFLKTHLPVDALVFSPQAKYIYIGRDGRDVLWSLYNHHANANAMFYDLLNNTPGLVGPALEPPTSSIRQYFHDWLQGDGYPFWSLWENMRSWWEVRHLPNVLLVHYAQLKQDLPGQMRRIAQFLDIPVAEAQWDAIVEHCTFDYMKRHAEQVAPLGGLIFEGGGQTFINKGTNGRWRDILTEEDSEWYETMAEAQLGAACAQWLAHGETP
ncbi:sulfotransferase domain-containing protein [Nodosilinea sp. PGN35]|uniref:sulfotransferase domain-containing protein n=1 Tax=Nodosilinea sp. PGN35 TaxID=3020489 RepID=UPI0023B22729|nr:sulfotransferase domain-containing protein [Nodosilinea sp. TSF1-S3]MDF0365663.1 sulfotransferase domain-containing protein [Nodosilinea sp. TSF1-S3]